MKRKTRRLFLLLVAALAAAGFMIQGCAGEKKPDFKTEYQAVLLGDGQVPTPEEVRDNYARICDMSGAKPFESANEVMGRVFGEIQRPSK